MLAALTFLASSVLARTTPKVVVLVPVMAGMQLALHQAFGTLSGHAAAGPGPAAHHEHLHGAALASQVSDVVGGGATSDVATHAVGSTMLVLHLLASAVAAVLVARGERAARAAAHWVRSVVLRLPAVPRPVPSARQVAITREATPRPRTCTTPLPARGPPGALLAV
ncbi:hypothetical protein [Paraoerskovia sediminicola]|uniref:hypothetical protein n=1 Tax=Paraoerskovia sediminicola TaxID=1138587 RepID=UPI002572A4CE|nr:hypothetical protein [Paraoerskovia sediminicola]